MNSCASIEVAVKGAEAERLSAFARAGPWCGPETILLVEDEVFVRKATAEALESAGYRIVVAGSAMEALEACRRSGRPIDLLLADVTLPEMSGHALAAEFERIHPHARVLLMSGHAEQLAGCERTDYAKKCLAKPFSIRVLLRKVREVLDTNLGAQS